MNQLGKLLATITELPQRVSVSLTHCLHYLTTFGLADVLTQTQFFSKFMEQQFMLLNANTLANLYVLRGFI